MEEEVQQTSTMDIQFLDMSEAYHPLQSADRSIIQSLVKPTTLPLPGDGGVWVTPRRRSPDCEFGDATAILKSLQLNPNAAVFEVPSPAEKQVTGGAEKPVAPPADTVADPSSAAPPPSAEKTTKKLNAASAPFVPNIPILLPTSHAHTIHINNLTANLNYHLLSTDNQPQSVKIPATSECKPTPVQSLPIPFTVNGSYPDYVHPFQNQNYRSEGYQSPVVVYQDPNINVYYPVLPQKDRNAHPAPAQKKQEILFGTTNTPVASVGKSNDYPEGQGIVATSQPFPNPERGSSSQTYQPVNLPSTPGASQNITSAPPPSSAPHQAQSAAHYNMQDGKPPPPVIVAQNAPTAAAGHLVYGSQTTEMADVQPTPANEPVRQQQQIADTVVQSAAAQSRVELDTRDEQFTSGVQVGQLNYSQITSGSHSAVPSGQLNLKQGPTPADEPASTVTLVQAPGLVYQNGYEPQSTAEVTPTSADSLSNASKIEQKAEEEAQQAQEPADVPEAAKSWSSLFKNQTSAPNPAVVNKPTARISPFTTTDTNNTAVVAVPTDEVESKSIELGKYLLAYKLSHYSPSLMPCGLSNRSNWCFVNAILQALVACPPFYNLFKTLPLVPGMKAGKAKSPMTESLIEFVHEFSPLETISKPPKKEKIRKKEDFRTGPCFEPGYVYKMLLSLADDTFKVVEGRQEDAEEFLTCLLNGVSDEMTALIKLVPKEVEEEDAGEPEEDLDEGDWQEVDSRGKSSVTRRVVEPAAAPVTPIQAMALGMCRSSLRAANGECSATLQPFFTLQLDIQNPEINSVNQALLQNFDSEDIDGYICQKTKQVVEASRSLSLEELPPILVLHMKRFVYDASTGGVQKVMKPVDFSVDLEIPKTVLSNEARPKFSPKQRQYKLFAVVYHTGREATKGHYVTDVYHTGYCTWLHCDDSIVSETSEQSVLAPSHTSSPYILFYRRCDTMVGLEKNKEKK